MVEQNNYNYKVARSSKTNVPDERTSRSTSLFLENFDRPLMKTDIKIIAQILSVAIWADDKYADEERDYISLLASTLHLDVEQFQATVDDSVVNIKNADDATVNTLLRNAASNVVNDDVEKEVILEASSNIVIADGVLEKTEVENILAITQALGVDFTEGVKTIISYIASSDEWTNALQSEIVSAIKESTSSDDLTANVLTIAERVAGDNYIVNK